MARRWRSADGLARVARVEAESDAVGAPPGTQPPGSRQSAPRESLLEHAVRVSLTGMGISAAIAVPLLAGGNPIGVVLGTGFAAVTSIWAFVTAGSRYTDHQR